MMSQYSQPSENAILPFRFVRNMNIYIFFHSSLPEENMFFLLFINFFLCLKIALNLIICLKSAILFMQ